ncbi:hypothetical protein DSO57_1022724 [Entomophthora muscae]|uniref:Uncharacterized protein n=1 Tax=Entomophthora muscae TaxID=34485 RepID=A0ACC2S554_9FUNG|nr:hypothetical protein DSO57_1022724 [Entomophthora muscae]
MRVISLILLTSVLAVPQSEYGKNSLGSASELSDDSDSILSLDAEAETIEDDAEAVPSAASPMSPSKSGQSAYDNGDIEEVDDNTSGADKPPAKGDATASLQGDEEDSPLAPTEPDVEKAAPNPPAAESPSAGPSNTQGEKVKDIADDMEGGAGYTPEASGQAPPQPSAPPTEAPAPPPAEETSPAEGAAPLPTDQAPPTKAPPAEAPPAETPAPESTPSEGEAPPAESLPKNGTTPKRFDEASTIGGADAKCPNLKMDRCYHGHQLNVKPARQAFPRCWLWAVPLGSPTNEHVWGCYHPVDKNGQVECEWPGMVDLLKDKDTCHLKVKECDRARYPALTQHTNLPLYNCKGKCRSRTPNPAYPVAEQPPSEGAQTPPETTEKPAGGENTEQPSSEDGAESGGGNTEQTPSEGGAESGGGNTEQTPSEGGAESGGGNTEQTPSEGGAESGGGNTEQSSGEGRSGYPVDVPPPAEGGPGEGEQDEDGSSTPESGEGSELGATEEKSY